MRAFTYEAHPARVLFGEGMRAQAGEEARRLAITRALVITLPRAASEWRQRLGELAVDVIDDAVMHVPAPVAERAVARAAEARADGVVAVGGGSSIGLAKAIAKQLGLPIVAVPTTYAGSEMTSIWGLTEDGQKRTGRDVRVRPRTVLYDPELVVSLPRPAAAASGLNAVAHAMEALYAKDVDPITQLLAEEAVRSLARHLPRPGAAPHDSELPQSREQASGSLYGAWLAGVCLDRAKMGLHHKLCHVLGGTFNLPHAETHAVVLPYVAAYNLQAAPDAMARLARALGHFGPSAAAVGLFALRRELEVPGSLAALGLKETDLEGVVNLVVDSPYDNPRPVDRTSLRALLQSAFAGDAPS